MLAIQYNTINQIYAQNTKANLAKYFLYRERLRKYFVVVDADDNPGTNIPFGYGKDNINNVDGYTQISDGDGNDELQYYLGMLATEYALFERYGFDVTQTKNELLYALKAVERLDRTAELYWDPNFSQDLNGFFIRDDIKYDFATTWQSKYPSFSNITRIGSCFVDGRNGYPYEESKDNVWNYIPNLALVEALVDDPEIRLKTRLITWRMITYMHYFKDWVTIPEWVPFFGGDDIGIRTWLIQNAATKSDLAEPPSGKIEEIGVNIYNKEGFNYGFAEAAKNISELPFTHYGASENCKSVFLKNFYNNDHVTTLSYQIVHAIDDLITNNFNASTYFTTRNSWLALATVAAQNSDLQSAVSDNNATVMNRLLQQLQRTDESYYEHLPLIRSLLVQYMPNLQRNFTDDIIAFYGSFNWTKPFYEHLLNIAPVCGPENLQPKTFDPNEVDEWGLGNRLTMSDKLVTPIPGKPNLMQIDNGDWFGIYNGIDYLMLHNLYWLTMLPYYGIVSISDNDADYWRNLAKQETNQGLAFIDNTQADYILYADQNQRKITSTRTIPKGYEINYTAAEAIDLVPGFTAESESCFDATINSDWVYEKTDYTILPNESTCFSDIPFSVPQTTIPVIAPSSISNSAEISSSLKSYSESTLIPKTKETITTKITNTIESLLEKKYLQVAPNPNTGTFSVVLFHNIGNFGIKICSINGTEIYSTEGVDDERVIISIPASGIYILNINTVNETFHRKIIVSK